MSAPKPRCADRFDFEEKPSLVTWPRELSGDLSLVENGVTGKGLRVAPSKGTVSAYNSLTFNGVGPGCLSLDFDYCIEGSAEVTIQVNFNLAGKGNGSAGRTSIPLEATDSWRPFHRIVSVPEGAAACQYVFIVSGKDAALLLDNATFAYCADAITVPIGNSVDFYAPATAPCWNPRDISFGFFTSGEDAQTPVQFQIAADGDGLYLLFTNFVNPENIRANVTQHDGLVWQDDANEVVLFDEARGIGWQFIATSKGTTLDGVLKQRVPGDPWATDTAWDGDWQCQGHTLENGFETRFFIPWKILGVNPAEKTTLAIQACGDFPATNEYPNWNNYRGTRFDVGKYGLLTIADGKLTLARNRDTAKLTYAIHREAPKFQELLEDGVPGRYEIDIWSMGINRSDFPKATMDKTSDELFTQWQDELLRAWAAAGIGGPAWPWLPRYGLERMKKRFEATGEGYPFFISNSDIHRRGRKTGAKFIDQRSDFTCDAVDPAFVEAVLEHIRAQKSRSHFDFMSRATDLVLGLDEPTNSPEQCYNPAFNPEHIDDIRALSETIRKDYGFGKYGVPFLEDVPAEDKPFARIAFYRWWNAQLLASTIRYQEAVNELLPGVTMLFVNDNNTAGQSNLDAANLNGPAKLVSTDPYPTSTNASYGMARALYHVGFSCRVLRDLVPSAKLMLTPQCFIYHGGHGDAEAMGEWCSQGLKNGAEYFMWFCTNAVHEIFPDYAAMLELSAMIHTMDRVKLPTETKTLVWYSNFDKWGASDSALHSAYSVYTMLAETLGCNFRFVADTTLTKGDVALSDYKLLIVPRMSYTTPEIAQALRNWVAEGGILVSLDPCLMRWNLDGTENQTHAELTGQRGALAVKTTANEELAWNGKTLPMAKIANAPALPGTRYESYEIAVPENAQILATYGDGAPAAIQRPVGKGAVIYFGAQPFAGSEVVTRFGAWREFFGELAKKVGEPTDLPIRDLQLPKPPNTVNLQKLIP